MPRIFVYGALMAGDPQLSDGHPAEIQDHAIRFTVKGIPLLEPSFASLDPAPGACAHGVVFQVSEKKWAQIRKRELGYDVLQLPCRSASGQETVLALTIGDAARSEVEVCPSARYAQLLVRGAELYDLPTETRQRYARLKKQGPRLSWFLSRPLKLAVKLAPVTGVIPAVALVLFLTLLPLILILGWLLASYG